MKRLRRRLLNLAAGVSFILCAVTMVLWVRSYLPESVHWGFRSGKGIFVFHDSMFPDAMLDAALRVARNPSYVRGSWNLAGIEVIHGGYNRSAQSYWMIGVPLLYVMIPLGAMPAWWLASIRRDAQRRKANLCRTCGYDLRASPDRCPECGAVPEIAEGVAP